MSITIGGFFGREASRPLLITAVPTVCGTHAQFVRGTLLGNVTDESGAVVPNAEVVLKNAGTNEVKNATTSSTEPTHFPPRVCTAWR